MQDQSLPDPTSATLPDERVRGEIVNDSAVFIDRSIRAVFHTILEAVVLVVLVIYLFLGNASATLIPALALPLRVPALQRQAPRAQRAYPRR